MEKGYVSLSILLHWKTLSAGQTGSERVLGKGSICVDLGRWLCASETEAGHKHSFYFILHAAEGQTVTGLRKEALTVGGRCPDPVEGRCQGLNELTGSAELT